LGKEKQPGLIEKRPRMLSGFSQKTRRCIPNVKVGYGFRMTILVPRRKKKPKKRKGTARDVAGKKAEGEGGGVVFSTAQKPWVTSDPGRARTGV